MAEGLLRQVEERKRRLAQTPEVASSTYDYAFNLLVELSSSKLTVSEEYLSNKYCDYSEENLKKRIGSDIHHWGEEKS